jgi:hypothetical protein
MRTDAHKHMLIKSALLSSALVLMCGCSTIQVWIGTRVRLEKTPVVSLQASLPQGPAMFPGEVTPLVAAVKGPDGKLLLTEGAGKGKVLWEDLHIASKIVTVNGEGMVAMPADPRISEGKVPHITVSVPSHPGIIAELDIPLRYDQHFTANFSGREGRSGMNGMDGMSGANGNDGFIDALNPIPGGDGSNGSDGSDGQDGEPGEDASPVQVRLTMRSGERPLLQASVSGAGHQEYYLVDPAGGSLTVWAEGGPGGPGGIGGNGGHGGNGGVGMPFGAHGLDGASGNSGRSGAAGRGGSITVRYDPATRPYLSQFHFSTLDGDGRPGPPPVFIEEPVAPFW